MREPEHVRVTQRGGLLLGRVGDRAHSLSEPVVGRRLDARLERVAPALISELNLFERHARVAAHESVAAHDCSPGPGPTGMMWSASFLGAAGLRRLGSMSRRWRRRVRSPGAGTPERRPRGVRDRPPSAGRAKSGRHGQLRGGRC